MDTRRHEQPRIEEADGVAFAAAIRPRSDRPSRPITAGVVVFVGGVLIGLALQPRGAVLTAQGTATPNLATPSITLTATSRPVTRPPNPTPPPIGTFPPPARGWAQGDLDLGPNVGATAVWSVGGKFLVLADADGRSRFWSSVDGRSWEVSEPSPAIVSYQAPAVIDGELWFVATVTGVVDAHMELVHTTPRGPIRTLGPATISPPDWARVLDHVNGTWVMSHGVYLPDGIGDGGREDLETSKDGVHWTTIHPTGADNLSFIRSGSVGGRMVVLANPAAIALSVIALVTTDGVSWRSASVPEMDGAAIFDMACGPKECVAVGSVTPDGGDLPTVWLSKDGLKWAQVPQQIALGTSATHIDAVAATDAGFIAVGGGDAWLSDAAGSWRHVAVLPPGAGSISLIAANGDRILAIGQDFKGVPASWTGSLSEIGS